MTQFGQPTRNATADANAGVINPPSKRRTTRQIATPSQRKQITTLDTGVEALGEALGGAISKRVEEEQEVVVNQKRVNAAARQGQDAAINSIDKMKKNVGWEKFIFGEDVEYRAAQQRAVTNGVRQQSLKLLSAIDTHAGMTPEEYEGELTNTLNSILEPFDDTETKTLATEAWLAQVPTLVEKQQRAHHVYTQTQNREKYDEEIQLQLDELTILGAQASTEEDAQKIMKMSKDLFNGVYTPSGMSEEVERELFVDRIALNLKEGNVGAYNAATATGWMDTLNPVDKGKIHSATEKYAEQLKLEASTKVEEANLQAFEASSIAEVDAIYNKLEQSLAQLEARKIGTLKGKEGILQERSEGVADEYKYKQRLKAAQEKARKAAAKKEADAAQALRFKAKVAAQIAGDPITQDPDLSMDKADKRAAMDALITDTGKTFLGEDATTRDIAAALLTNDEFNLKVLGMWKNHEAASQIVNTAIETFANSDLSNWVTDKGTLAPTAIDMITRLERFRTARKDKFNAILEGNKDTYMMLVKGIQAGHTQKRIMSDIEQYRNRSTEKLPFKKVQVGSDFLSKSEYISHILSDYLTGQGEKVYPTAQDLNEFTEVFERGLEANYQDPWAAKEYLLDHIANSQQKVHLGGKTHLVNKLGPIEGLDHELNDILRYADNKNKFAEHITSLVGKTGDIDAAPITKLEELDNLQVYTVKGMDGIMIKVPKAINPVMITSKHLRNLSEEMTQRKKEKQLVEQLNIEAKARRDLMRYRERTRVQPM
jgi:hypothetical protein